MNIFESITSDKMHHAYLIVGDVNISREKICSTLSKMEFKISGNPDVQNLKYGTLTIDIARDLATSVAQKSFGESSPVGEEGQKIFLVEADIITEEAQNSLLKVLEEPTPGTHFFILMPQDILLPTLRSRLQIINMSRTVLDTKILDMKITERLELVKEITDGISEAKSSNGSIARSDEVGFREEKTKQDAITLLNQIESELYSRGMEQEALNLKVCQETRNALYDRGTPVKMVLENLMLSI